jgi:acetyl-CoA carboxylase carboxyltransferase component
MEDAAERDAAFKQMVDFAYDRGKAINTASYVELDAVIDPADTRSWLARGLAAAPPPAPRRRFIDTW